MSRLFVHHHTGLGDQFDCNALVRHICHHRKSIDEKGFDVASKQAKKPSGKTSK